jgi:hypothetical protein
VLFVVFFRQGTMTCSEGESSPSKNDEIMASNSGRIRKSQVAKSAPQAKLGMTF